MTTLSGFWITLICKNCNNLDNLSIEQLQELMLDGKKKGRKEKDGNLYLCPYGCMEKSDLHIYEIEKE